MGVTSSPWGAVPEPGVCKLCPHCYCFSPLTLPLPLPPGCSMGTGGSCPAPVHLPTGCMLHLCHSSLRLPIHSAATPTLLLGSGCLGEATAAQVQLSDAKHGDGKSPHWWHPARTTWPMLDRNWEGREKHQCCGCISWLPGPGTGMGIGRGKALQLCGLNPVALQARSC